MFQLEETNSLPEFVEQIFLLKKIKEKKGLIKNVELQNIRW
jgi:hypothetical protein